MSETHNQDKSAGHGEGGFELFDFYVAQLEAYLDGELSAAEASAVRQRLVQEDAYAAALGRLHAQRAQRAEVFDAIERHETTPQEAARLSAAARQLALREHLQPAAPSRAPAAASAAGAGWPMWAKVVMGMAACVLVGFGAGLVGDYQWEGPTRPGEAAEYDTAGADGRAQWVYYNEKGEPVTAVPAEGRPMPDPMRGPVDRTNQAPPR